MKYNSMTKISMSALLALTLCSTPIIVKAQHDIYHKHIQKVRIYPQISATQGVLIQDPALDAAIREQLNLSLDEMIDASTANKLRTLDVADIELTSLSGLEHFSQLRSLQLNGTLIYDFTPLASLQELSSFSLIHAGTNDISALANLTQLQYIRINQTKIQDFSCLSELQQVTNLYLNENAISNLNVLQKMNKLQTLELSGNLIQDISPLSSLKSIQHLELNATSSNISNQNNILDFTPLKDTSSLMSLSLQGYEQLSDISFVSGLVSLKKLQLSHNGIVSIDALASLSNLESLYLSYNHIETISVLSSLHKIQYVDLMENNIEDISSIAKMNPWKSMNLSYNKMKDISIFSSFIIPEGSRINLAHNHIEDISSIKGQAPTSLSLDAQSIYLDNIYLGDVGNNPVLDMNGSAPVFGYLSSGSVVDGTFKWTQAGEQYARFSTSPLMFNFSGTVYQKVIGEGYIAATYSTVTIRYRSWENGLDLITPIVMTGRVGSMFETQSKSFEGVSLVKQPIYTSGDYANDNLTITYWYSDGSSIIEDDTPEPTSRMSVIIKHMNEENQLLEEASILIGEDGEHYEATSQNFSGYKLKEEPSNKNGVFGIDKEVIFVYEKDNGNQGSVSTGDTTNYIILYVIVVISLLNIGLLVLHKTSKKEEY